MSDSGAALEEANRCAHTIARLAARRVRLESTWHSAHGSTQKRDLARKLYNTNIEIDGAVDAYEEIERRAQTEATG